MTDQPYADTSMWQHTTLTRERHPCPRRGSKQPTQQSSGTATRLKPAGCWVEDSRHFLEIFYFPTTKLQFSVKPRLLLNIVRMSGCSLREKQEETRAGQYLRLITFLYSPWMSVERLSVCVCVCVKISSLKFLHFILHTATIKEQGSTRVHLDKAFSYPEPRLFYYDTFT